MLYRFREAMKSAEEIDNPRINFSEPPPDPNTLQNTKQLIKWRDFLLRDISRKVGSMGTSSMSDTQVMDLNDEINKLVRTKNAFDRRIMELGGEKVYLVWMINCYLHTKIASLPGKDTYVYYGRAKDLPGVKESLTEKEAMINMESEEAQPDEEKISKKGDIIKSLDAQYYGYRDEEEDDEEAMEILKLEEAAEKFCNLKILFFPLIF